MKIFLISPVREATDEEKIAIKEYKIDQEAQGNEAYVPSDDTFQGDDNGILICAQNRLAIQESDEVHIWWNGKSQGSLFDIGMAFAMSKVIRLANSQSVTKTENKSFENVLLTLNKIGANKMARKIIYNK